MADDLDVARDHFLRRSWADACEAFISHDSVMPLGVADLERLAIASYLVGRNTESDEAWVRAYRACLEEGDPAAAIRCGFWIAFRLVNAFDEAGANGWVARLERLVADLPGESLEASRLAYLTGLRAVFEGDLDRGEADLRRSSEIAEREGDEELAAIARLSLGRVLIFRGDLVAGTHLLDEAMLAVMSEDMSPIAVGDSYCTAIDACHDLIDVQRGQLWTDALTRWCADQQGMVPFLGVCQVHRAEFLQLRGAWVEAMAQAGLARARLAEPFRQLAYGAAVYQQGELHRLRGQFDRAEVCYREASASGRDPQPGLAMLRLANGNAAAATHALDRALAETGEPGARAPLLEAMVSAELHAGDRTAARAAADELATIAGSLKSPMLDAMSERAFGAVLLEAGDARSSLAHLRRAGSGFRELETPYDAARTGVLIAQACLQLGDDEGARLELEAAKSVLVKLGARPDLARLDGVVGQEEHGRLTARELQILRLVARGSTNRSIGNELGISERTVDRHVSNIFAKLGVGSRAAATSVAFQSGLL